MQQVMNFFTDNVTFGMGQIALILMVIIGVTSLGYGLGRITIKGVSLGTAGVFIVALLFGALFPDLLSSTFAQKMNIDAASAQKFVDSALSLVESMGLILFVTAVGFIAGPNFFANFKKNFKSYILLGLVIIIAGGLAAVGCIYLGRFIEGGNADFDPQALTAMVVGLLSGSLTSTPAFSAAKETVAEEYVSLISVGHGIAYLFGVIGVVLFVQLIPKMVKANMDQERARLTTSGSVSGKIDRRKYLELDEFGIAAFGIAAIVGVLLGGVKLFKFFTLGTTGGTLIVSLIVGYLAHIGPVSVQPKESTLKIFREFGLTLFLVGAGIPGGIEFVAEFKVMYFVYGVIMTMVPLIVGFLFAKYVLKLSLLNNLGSITGGMTSTPALGTLIHVAGTEDVASAYAATYPIALIAVVIVSQLLIIFF